MLKILGQKATENELKDMIKEVDDDGNGTVEFKEFVMLMVKNPKKLTKKQEYEEDFKMLDKKSDKHICERELKFFMRKIAKIPISSVVARDMVKFAIEKARPRKEQRRIEDL